MPILNGKRVSLDEWRAAQAAAASPAVEEEAEAEIADQPQPQRRRPSRREQTVRAALGISDEPAAEAETVGDSTTEESNPS